VEDRERAQQRAEEPGIQSSTLEPGDRDFRKARKYARRRFFSGMHAALRHALHEIWQDFLVFITEEEDLE
jgi:hypothetical protein